MSQKSIETRLKLMRTAEELFAQQGIDAVSLATINRQAGQANQKAATYHFGDKRGLMTAIMDRHSEDIEQRRKTMLENLDGTPTLRQLVELVVLPIASKLDDPDGGMHYLNLSGQVLANDEYNKLRLKSSQRRSELVKVMAMLEPYTSQFSEDERATRNLLAYSMLYQGLAFVSSSELTKSRSISVAVLVEAIEQVLTGGGRDAG